MNSWIVKSSNLNSDKPSAHFETPLLQHEVLNGKLKPTTSTFTIKNPNKKLPTIILSVKPKSTSFFIQLSHKPTSSKPFPKITKIPISKRHLNLKLNRATLRRQLFIQSRVTKIAHRYATIKYKLLLQKQHERLARLKIESLLECKMALANLNRMVYIRGIADACSARIEYVEGVCLNWKLMMKRDQQVNELDEYDMDECQVAQPSDTDSDVSTTAISVFKHEMLVQAIQEKTLHPSMYTELDEKTYLVTLSKLLPSITRFTLRELDLVEILNCTQLRHDLYFDPDLTFKPNERKESSKELYVEKYWNDLSDEINGGNYSRVVLLLHEISQIIIELLPSSDKITAEIEANIDVQLIHQQIQHSSFDPTPLIQYIHTLLKSNCASARDDAVDMLLSCKSIPESLRLCFNLLEVMKLDYANHQLTQIRPHITEHAVSYELTQFTLQCEYDPEIPKTTYWLTRNLERIAAKSHPFPPKSMTPRNVLHSAILSMILDDGKQIENPETFYLDTDRITNFFNDWQDVTVMGCLLVVFKQFGGRNVAEVKKGLWVLLNDSGTSFSHISLYLSQAIGGMSEEAKDGLTKMVEKTLGGDAVTHGRVYEVVQNRVGNVLLGLLSDGKAEDDVLRRFGLVEFKSEIVELANNIKEMVDFNLKVYGKVYDLIMEELLIKEE